MYVLIGSTIKIPYTPVGCSFKIYSAVTYDNKLDEHNHPNPILLYTIYIDYRSRCLSAIADRTEPHTGDNC